jgi:hypothetical protein
MDEVDKFIIARGLIQLKTGLSSNTVNEVLDGLLAAIRVVVREELERAQKQSQDGEGSRE